MFMGQSNNGTTHAGPKRKIQIGAALRKHTDGLTLRELAVQTGLVSSSISATASWWSDAKNSETDFSSRSISTVNMTRLSRKNWRRLGFRPSRPRG
jgi:hypothetical protein